MQGDDYRCGRVANIRRRDSYSVSCSLSDVGKFDFAARKTLVVEYEKFFIPAINNSEYDPLNLQLLKKISIII
jgi:hypothetical protein